MASAPPPVRGGGRAVARLAGLTLCALLVAALPAGCNWPPALRDDKEIIYDFLSDGSGPAAQALLGDVWDLGERSEPIYIAPDNWTSDPFNDSYWRFLFYSLRPTSNLLWAYNKSGDVRYRDKLHAILRSFLAHDRTRSLDRRTFDNRHAACFRAMVLVNSYFKLKRANGLPEDLEAGLRAAIYRLGSFLEDPDNFEEGQNHGINEAAALLLIAENFPEAKEAPAWGKLARDRLMQLMSDSVDRDGVQVENSPFYHFYVLTFVLQINNWAERYHVPLEGFSAKFPSMVRYGAYITQPDGHTPLMGASVDYDMTRSNKALYAAVGKDDPAFEFVRTMGRGGAPAKERAAVFPESGHVVFRSAFSAGDAFSQDTHLVFGAGPYRTSHSHLDRLSFILFSAGRPLLVDSGLFTYDPGAEFTYFHGTSAHNTVVVDGKDQREGAGALGLHAEGADWLYQSGRHGLYDGVVHGRAVLLLGRDLVVVVDALRSEQSHDYTQTWHLFPDAVASVEGQAVVGRPPGGGQPPNLRVQALQPSQQSAAPTLSLVQGREPGGQPMQGWFSDTYRQKVPAPVAEYRLSGKSASFLTLIATGARAAAPLAAQVGAADNTLSLCVAGHQVRLTGVVGEGETVSISPAESCP